MKTIFWVVGVLIVIMLGGSLLGLSLHYRMLCLMLLVLIAAILLFWKGIRSKDTISILIFSILSLSLVVCVYFYLKQSLYF